MFIPRESAISYMPIFSTDAPLAKSEKNLVKSPWGEDKSVPSWVKREVQLRASFDETGLINIQEKIRYPLAMPFKKAYKWVRKLLNNEFKTPAFARLSVEIPLYTPLLNEFKALDSTRQSEVLSQLNQTDLLSWQKEAIKEAITQAVAFYAEKPDDNFIQPWHAFHKVYPAVSDAISSKISDKIEAILSIDPAFVQQLEDDAKAENELAQRFQWDLLGASLKSIKDLRLAADWDMDTRVKLGKGLVHRTIKDLAQAEFEDHADKSEILSLLEKCVTDEAIESLAENATAYKATFVHERKEVEIFMQKVIEAAINGKDIMSLMFSS